MYFNFSKAHLLSAAEFNEASIQLPSMGVVYPRHSIMHSVKQQGSIKMQTCALF